MSVVMVVMMMVVAAAARVVVGVIVSRLSHSAGAGIRVGAHRFGPFIRWL